VEIAQTRENSSEHGAPLQQGQLVADWFMFFCARALTVHVEKLVIYGPADYLMLKSTDVVETISGVADRIERDSWAKAFGLECFAGSLRCMMIEPGTCLAVEGQQSDALYLIVQGECRASVQRHQPRQKSPCSSVVSKAMTTAMVRNLVVLCSRRIHPEIVDPRNTCCMSMSSNCPRMSFRSHRSVRSRLLERFH